ncbi:MAG: pyridoxamine 5'-phosphate oxidase family protein [Peptococcaceae bacterium]|jgi:nitroimidazol reductase NimA-like FMN-containing flavoprotein (pyridoxamine 5'-phosphate oxidase superfamily)|nr:pyridoxamine 5'-phosphate oxidase family protein [Peptococcaceae bacterium]
MRRSDRAITKREEILEVLNKCDVIRLGINTHDYPYIVPLNFGVEDTKPLLTIYLHSATEGLKLDLISKDSRVGFEADCSHRLIVGDVACDYTMEYESVIGCGVISVRDDDEWKKRGLQAIMRHYDPERVFDFTEQQLAAVCILQIDVTRITGKRLKR